MLLCCMSLIAHAVAILPFTWEVTEPVNPGQAPGGVNISYDQDHDPITLDISTGPLLSGQYVKTLYWTTEFDPGYCFNSWEGNFSSPTVSHGSYEVLPGKKFNTKVSFPDNNFTSGDRLTFSLQSPFLALPSGNSWAMAEIGNVSGGSSYYHTAVPEPSSYAAMAAIGLVTFGIIRRKTRRHHTP